MTIQLINLDDPKFPIFCEMPGFEIPDYSIESKLDMTYFHVGLLVQNGSEILGRCALFLNPNHHVNSEKTLTLGYFESYPDFQIAQALFMETVKIAKSLQCSRLLGPINSSTWNQYRFNTNKVSDPFTSEYFVPEYYLTLWKAYGFTVDARYKSDKIYLKGQSFNEVNRIRPIQNSSIIISDLTQRNLDNELNRISAITLEAFVHNPYYSPIHERAFKEIYPAYYLEQIRRQTLIAEDLKGNLLAFLLAFPNTNDRTKKGLIIKTLARKPGIQERGVGISLTQSLIKRAIKDEYDYIINAYCHEDNVSSRISKGLGGQAYRSYELLTFTIT